MSASDFTPLQFRWYLSVAAVLFLFVVVGVYSSRMAHDTAGYDQQQALLRKQRLDKMQDADRKTLTTADWLDQSKGTVRIPIDEAMPQEVALLKAKPVAAGTAVAGAAPAPAAATPADAAPAATTAPGAVTNATPAAPGTPPASTNTPAVNPPPAK